MEEKGSVVNITTMLQAHLQTIKKRLAWIKFRAMWGMWGLGVTGTLLLLVIALTFQESHPSLVWFLIKIGVAVSLFGHVLALFIEHSNRLEVGRKCESLPFNDIPMLEQLGHFLPEDKLTLIRNRAHRSNKGLLYFHIIDFLEFELQAATPPPTEPPSLASRQIAALTKKTPKETNSEQ